MRTIDADALKKAYFNAINETSIGEVSIIDLIDNAPTVENITIFAELGEDMADITREIMPQLLAKIRPQGEWLMESKLYGGFGDSVLAITCSICKESFIYRGKTHNFCPNCGAEMRGKEE